MSLAWWYIWHIGTWVLAVHTIWRGSHWVVDRLTKERV